MLKVLIKIMSINNMFVNDLKNTLLPYSINTSEFSVLEFLYSKNGQTVDEIRKKILLSSGSVTYVIDNLVKKNFVYRKKCENDKRVYYINLTDDGRKIIDEIFPIHIKNTKKLFSNFKKDEIEDLNVLLRKFKRKKEK